MDEIDTQILSLLRTNGRASFASIGAQVGLSPHGTADRVRKLEREGVITGYAAKVGETPAPTAQEITVLRDLQARTARAHGKAA